MSTKQVKVDNWGIYFLQRLKHFFNRTDYCDLTLQFQDNAQLKVHRLVLSACTEYFELLERTCEMYEDCLVMPDDLQADVVVPIVNFMYTGQLEFKQELLEKLYQTSLVMNMPVLSKLLFAHRQNIPSDNRQTVPIRPAPMHSYSKISKQDTCKQKKMPVASSSGMGYKRSFSKSFEHDNGPKSKKSHLGVSQQESIKNGQSSDSYKFPVFCERNKQFALEPRPTRYELPEELDEDNVFDNSFTSISYASKPLMVHPETVKQYGSKKTHLFEDATSSKRFFRGTSNDIVECRKISMHTNLFDDGPESIPEEEEPFQPPSNKEELKDASQLFDQFIESEGPKLTIETKDSKQVNNIDHAKIISEVLKKYPHLMKSNKNIKLKILDTPSKAKKKVMPSSIKEEKEMKPKQEIPDFTYESDVIDSKEAARLIALGAENINGPWICLICGTPGRALHFTSYYKFRRHLVEIHNEKPVSTICEYCGLKSLKRNYLLHHLYTKHGIEPPSNYNFPKCNYCDYIALTEVFLVKHKMTHTEYKGFRCNVCAAPFGTSNQLLHHIQKTGHKYSAERKTNLQCIYCLKVFLREANLYTHLKTHHKQAAKTDGIIDDSEDERYDEESTPSIDVKLKQHNESINMIKYELPRNLDNSYATVQYQLEQKEDSNVQIVSKRSKVNESRTAPAKHKILNTSFESQNQVTQSSNSSPKKKIYQEKNQDQTNFLQDIDSGDCSANNDDIILIDNNEYIIHNNQLVPKKERSNNEEYTMANSVTGVIDDTMPVLAAETLLEFQNIPTGQSQASRMIVKKNTNINQPIQIVVSNEEEYKALMASNHSIIFDDGDPNKTLTVLTTQTSMPMETNTIDLETSQSNEMMIIPDNYPISVTETVPSDNSNIVVLYSHPIDDQDGQHITRQSIEAQFVQSSAIITQNFETVTTCTPVMSAHVVNTSVEETWQANVTENINKLPITSTETSIATVAPIESIATANLNELPEIQLPTGTDLPNEISQQSLANTNEVDSTVNVYSQPEEIENNDTLVSEEVGNDNILNSENQSDIVNSFNLLEQNIITTEIQPQTNIIINNSSQIDLSVLANDGTLCHTTDNDSNNDNTITDNIDMAHLQTDVIVTTAPVHIEEIQTTESIVHNEPVTDTDDSILSKNSQESHIVENQEGQIVETQESQTDENQGSETVEFQVNETVESPENETDQNQESNMAEESSVENSVTIEVQHMGHNENLVPVNYNKEIESTENNNLENETESGEITETPMEEIIVEPNTINQDVESAKITENNESVISNITEITKLNQTKLSNTSYKENIENLTSEWSEDESDVQPEQNTQPNVNVEEPENSPEMEESIESIQHEIDKHLATSAKEALAEREQRKSFDQDLIVPQNKIVPNEKISSLLNDWDDNDSQEDVSPEQSTVENDIGEKENAVTKINENENINKDSVLKSDNIKSLVSDWDEEEEQEMKD